MTERRSIDLWPSESIHSERNHAKVAGDTIENAIDSITQATGESHAQQRNGAGEMGLPKSNSDAVNTAGSPHREGFHFPVELAQQETTVLHRRGAPPYREGLSGAARLGGLLQIQATVGELFNIGVSTIIETPELPYVFHEAAHEGAVFAESGGRCVERGKFHVSPTEGDGMAQVHTHCGEIPLHKKQLRCPAHRTLGTTGKAPRPAGRASDAQTLTQRRCRRRQPTTRTARL